MKNNNINKILDTSHLNTNDIKWIDDKNTFKKYIKTYYKELDKNEKVNKKINKKQNNDEIEVLDFEEKINLSNDDVIEILDFTKTIDVSKIVDINKAKEKAKKKVILKKNILHIIITACVIGIILTIIIILYSSGQKKDNNKMSLDVNKDITTKKIKVNDEDIIDDDLYSKYTNLNMLEVNFNDLLNTNPDTKGWIKVSGTKINYPFVQKDNNEYYLNHSYDKTYNVRGWVFLDYRNDINNLKNNTIIYAHGLKNNLMFGSLRKIVDEKWYKNKNNHIIYISTPKSNMIWKVFSSYTIEPESYYITTDFSSKDEYMDFLGTLKARSVYDYGVNLKDGDKILTLSSCYDDNVRMVLHAKLIAIKKR